MRRRWSSCEIVEVTSSRFPGPAVKFHAFKYSWAKEIITRTEKKLTHELKIIIAVEFSRDAGNYTKEYLAGFNV